MRNEIVWTGAADRTPWGEHFAGFANEATYQFYTRFSATPLLTLGFGNCLRCNGDPVDEPFEGVPAIVSLFEEALGQMPGLPAGSINAREVYANMLGESVLLAEDD
jgi:hypothetical protein